MLPCCECHPGQDHVTQNRVQCAQSTAGTAQMGGGGGLSTVCVGQPVVTACKISNISISFSYHFAWNEGLDFVFLLD